jgi:hypothetical protein
VPPTGAEYLTEWQRVGAIKTRITGVKVWRAPLQDRAGNWYYSPEPVLQIWVETRAVDRPSTDLRRWASIADPALLFAGMKQVPKSKFTNPRGELAKGTRLIPGGRSVGDVLLFELPDSTAEALALRMDASHVGESGRFLHVIREDAWKR